MNRVTLAAWVCSISAVALAAPPAHPRLMRQAEPLEDGGPVFFTLYADEIWKAGSFGRCAGAAADCIDDDKFDAWEKTVATQCASGPVAVRFMYTNPNDDATHGQSPLPGLTPAEYLVDDKNPDHPTWAPRYDTPGFQEFDREAVSQLATRLAAVCPGNVSWVEIGSFGYWGEWNHDEFSKKTVLGAMWDQKLKVVQHYFAAFPSTPLTITFDALLDAKGDTDAVQKDGYRKLVGALSGSCVGLRIDALGQPDGQDWFDQGVAYAQRTSTTPLSFVGPSGGEFYQSSIDDGPGAGVVFANALPWMKSHGMTHVTGAGAREIVNAAPEFAAQAQALEQVLQANFEAHPEQYAVTSECAAHRASVVPQQVPSGTP